MHTRLAALNVYGESMSGTTAHKAGAARKRATGANKSNALPGQAVLVLQGGGALGAFQMGAYQALHSAGIEPDWVIGTSIGAINGVAAGLRNTG